VKIASNRTRYRNNKLVSELDLVFKQCIVFGANTIDIMLTASRVTTTTIRHYF